MGHQLPRCAAQRPSRRHLHTSTRTPRGDAHRRALPAHDTPRGAYMWVYNPAGQATSVYHRYLSRLLTYLLLSLSVRDGSPSARKLAIRCPSARRLRRKARLRGRPTSPPALRRTTRKRHPATAYSGCRPFAKRSGAATNPLECCEHKTYEQRAARSCPWCRQV